MQHFFFLFLYTGIYCCFLRAALNLFVSHNQSTPMPVAPVVQAVNLEFYLCLNPGFEPEVGRSRTFDHIRKNQNQNGFDC